MFDKIIILFFIILIVYNIINYFCNTKEGMTTSKNSYTEYKDDPLILAKKNASNIGFLKEKIDEMNKIINQNENDIKINSDSTKTNKKNTEAILEGQRKEGEKRQKDFENSIQDDPDGDDDLNPNI